MSVMISGVEKGSLAKKAGILPGEELVSINGNEILDVLDYRFYMTEERLSVLIRDRDGKPRKISIRKDEYDDIGLEFETYLMDKQQSCRNQCIFCFIDQMPPGMRESLYFKDDDARMSFLFGNYITLTNLTDRDVERIIKMHISPVNISVHTTNPELRCKMMKNRFAGESLRHMYRLAQAGIGINCQLVLCPGINDGEELKKSLEDLENLYPSVQSIACVPVGLTDYREGLYPLEPYTPQSAAEVIRVIDEFSDRTQAEHGVRLCYPADEFFLTAGIPIPDGEYYGDFNQLENGVGMLATMRDEFAAALKLVEDEPCKDRKISIATGVAASDFIRGLVDEAGKKWHNLDCTVYAVKNDFFGHKITVTGLLTGRDLIAQLKDRDLGETLLLSSSMLRQNTDVFLDDVTVPELEKALGVRVRVTENDGYDFLDALLGVGE